MGCDLIIRTKTVGKKTPPFENPQTALCMHIERAESRCDVEARRLLVIGNIMEQQTHRKKHRTFVY